MADISKQLILGVEGGATKTHWSLCEKSAEGTRLISHGTLGPGSAKLLTEAELRELLSRLPKEAQRVGLFLAGCATEQDREALRTLGRKIWPKAEVRAGSDRASGFAAALGEGDGIAVIAGTGSAVTGRKEGKEIQAGGWGHLLGDSGGGYDLAIHALRHILFDFDTGQRITPFAADVLRTLGLNTLRELTAWAQTAKKNDLAKLTPLLFQHAEEPEVRGILLRGAKALADLTASVARHLALTAPSVRLMGGVFLRQPLYRELFATEVAKEYPDAEVAVCETEGSLGAVRLAGGSLPAPEPVFLPQVEARLAKSLTEQANPLSEHLSEKTTHEVVELFVQEEQRVEEALAGAVEELTAAVDLVTASLKQGGRLFYVGAGTSGRLGLLDASEMPPTFGVEPGMVQAILAGGISAFQTSVEGAEDSRDGGAQTMRDRGVKAADVVCGITASGRTPFVLGALEAARKIGTKTIFLTCNPQRDKSSSLADVEIDLASGPELITGSTRLKAGTATKLALNIISSGTMIGLGRVDGNSMSCLLPTNEKLRDRAVRIITSRLKISPAEAAHALACAKWNIRDAMQILASKTGES